MAGEKIVVPLNVPLCLRGQNGNNLQNQFFFRTAKCENTNTLAWEQLIILQTEDGKYVIQSRWNWRFLQVQSSGKCVFANHNQQLFETFDIEVDEEGHLYFISCHTSNVMQCTGDGSVWCVNTNRQAWEAWTVIYPGNTNIMTSSQLRTISLTAAAGICAGPLAGVVAGALVPAAMSTFGTVVAGVGTMHAPLSAWGLAATLQSTSAALMTSGSAAVGGVIGSVAGGSLAGVVEPTDHKR